MIRLDGALPYPSCRQPLYARNVVSTSQPLAAQARPYTAVGWFDLAE